MQPHKLSGQLLISNVNQQLSLLTKLITTNNAIKIDLSGINNIDSAGVAFLLELKSVARQNNCTLNFVNLPDAVDKFCQLYQVTL